MLAMQHRALLVEVDFKSGERAGGVDPKDPNLQCYGWQSIPDQPGPDLELRLVEDDRDLTEYEDAPGVRVLTSEEEVNEAIEEYIPPKYNADMEEVRAWLKERGEPVTKHRDKAGQARLKALKEEGAPVREEPPHKVKSKQFGQHLG